MYTIAGKPICIIEPEWGLVKDKNEHYHTLIVCMTADFRKLLRVPLTLLQVTSNVD